MSDLRSVTPRILASFMFIAPNGLFVLLIIGRPLGATRGESWDTFGDSVIREGVRFRSCESDLFGWHFVDGGVMIMRSSVLNLHAGHTGLNARNMVFGQ